MKSRISIEQLLLWRQKQAEGDAPTAPSAARLLELSRPWWERWPDEFMASLDRLKRVQIGFGHAMDEPEPTRLGHPVAVLVGSSGESEEGQARILYLSVRQGQLRLRFQLDGVLQQDAKPYEITFICSASHRPLVVGSALPSIESEYRVETELPPDLARDWERLRVADRMPFRFILRA